MTVIKKPQKSLFQVTSEVQILRIEKFQLRFHILGARNVIGGEEKREILCIYSSKPVQKGSTAVVWTDTYLNGRNQPLLFLHAPFKRNKTAWVALTGRSVYVTARLTALRRR